MSPQKQWRQGFGDRRLGSGRRGRCASGEGRSSIQRNYDGADRTLSKALEQGKGDGYAVCLRAVNTTMLKRAVPVRDLGECTEKFNELVPQVTQMLDAAMKGAPNRMYP